jgi:homoserine O-acetyltransferase/O-succinyltransferase
MGASDYYTEELHGPQEYLDLGGFALSSGRTLPSARLAYRTFGELNAAKDNAILLAHMYSGTSGYMELFIGEDRPLDPSRYFLILPAQLGSGFGSSPSTTPPPFDRGAFPPVSIADDVRAQHALVRDHFGIARLALVSGWSMGGMQTYEWAVRHPEMVARAMPLAACARTPDHDKVFIDVHTELLRSDPAFNGGFYRDSADVALGLRRHALAFALVGTTPEMFRGEVWRELGLASLEDYVEGFVQAYFLPMDPNNLLCQARKWRDADVGWEDGDTAAALGRITARTIVVAFEGDAFFPPEDVEADAALVPAAEFRVTGSVWGHFTMFNLRPQDTEQIDALYAEILAA